MSERRRRGMRGDNSLQVGCDRIWLFCGTWCVSRDKGLEKLPFSIGIPRLQWILLSCLRKPLHHTRKNNHSTTEAQAKRAMVAYESSIISSFIRVKELGVKLECIYEKNTCQEDKHVKRNWKHKPREMECKTCRTEKQSKRNWHANLFCTRVFSTPPNTAEPLLCVLPEWIYSVSSTKWILIHSCWAELCALAYPFVWSVKYA